MVYVQLPAMAARCLRRRRTALLSVLFFRTRAQRTLLLALLHKQ